MRTHLLLTSFAFLTLLASCQDYKNISVVGQIADEVTGKPIPKAKVVVLCWYNYGLDDATFKKQTIVTDEKGNFKATFEKGYQVDVASKAQGFIANRSYNELKDNRILVNLKLAKAKENPTLIKCLSIDYGELYDTNKTPFLRIRIHEGDMEETFGFDFRTQSTSNDTSKCDIWFKPINKNNQTLLLQISMVVSLLFIPMKSTHRFFMRRPQLPRQVIYMNSSSKETKKDFSFYVETVRPMVKLF